MPERIIKTIMPTLKSGCFLISENEAIDIIDDLDFVL
jgi:hypothetical protein